MEILSPQDVTQRRKRGQLLQREGNSRNLPESRVAVLSTFNVELLPPLLQEALERIGLYGDVYVGRFGQVAQEVLSAPSGLYVSRPESVVLLPAVEDWLAPLFADPLGLPAAAVEALVEERIEELKRLLLALLDRLPNATCYVVVFGAGQAPTEAVLDPGAPGRGQAAVERLLAEVRGWRALSGRVVVVDWDWRTRSAGSSVYRDERLWYLGRMRLNPLGLATLADLVVQHIAAYRGMARKVAVLDLDNTLWGGVVGEVGLSGIVLGEEGLGLAFQDFQRELLKLHRAGVLLAVCSKNNPEDAWEAFDRHSGMVLRREHLAAARVNWQDKATNLFELSEELNLAIDSFVFLDDNPVERQWIRETFPQVLVPDLPEDPAYWPLFLRRAPYFQRIVLTEADTRRAETYRAQAYRRQLQESVASIEEFLASLEQKIRIEAVHEGSVARAAQMCQRTNQFNLTSRRHTAADIEQMKKDLDVEVYTVSVQDRFGDSGITGLGILRFAPADAEIDTFLLSCRILGRKIEDQLLDYLVERARARGARRLMGRYCPTAKNAQVARFYSDRGFEPIGGGLFLLPLQPERPEARAEKRGRACAHA